MNKAGELMPNVKFFEGERWLVLTGLLGFLLAGICGVWVLLNGGPVAPDGDVAKAISFNAALGLFLLTTAAIVPFAAMKSKGKAFFRWGYILLALYSYFAETVQNFRGVNPRFVEDGAAFDTIVSNIFALVAFLLILFYLFLGIQYFRSRAYAQRPELVLGIRYAMIAIVVSFAAGLWLSFNQGRFTGQAGNIIWFHGLGFHALQAVPFVAWLAERKSPSSSVRRRLIHVTGIAFLIGLLTIGLQTLLGDSIFEWTALPIIALCSFLIAMVPVLFLLRQADNKKWNIHANG